MFIFFLGFINKKISNVFGKWLKECVKKVIRKYGIGMFYMINLFFFIVNYFEGLLDYKRCFMMCVIIIIVILVFGFIVLFVVII